MQANHCCVRIHGSRHHDLRARGSLSRARGLGCWREYLAIGGNHKTTLHGEARDGDIGKNHPCPQRVFGACVSLGYIVIDLWQVSDVVALEASVPERSKAIIKKGEPVSR
jgi:hypothetical protein